MPPSPLIRVSPGREMRAENHKRGRSLEGGILHREKDDDLALFNEVQNKERENFLLQSDDNFDDIFSTKLRYFSDHKLGISIPPRGRSNDLLDGEGDKNDYDWLMTPPDTPLFSSLDDETEPVNLVSRGRPRRSLPVSLSRSSTMEKSHKTSRGSASPHRLSPSPLSEMQSRGTSSSTIHASPPPNLRNPTPTRRPSPPPSKGSGSIPAPRSSTPTSRRMSTGSTTNPSRIRGTSPVKTSRGNSASPKIRAWQSTIPGFSSEAPPNLRTSMTDRPASYVRGSSPASRSSSRSGRQSISPTASRSVSSSHGPFGSYGKGSVASSGDDDIDSLQSVPISYSEVSGPSSVGGSSHGRPLGFSKKPVKRVLSSSSVPKRSFDLALRHMDRQKTPPNMFRPLMSSVPSSTFYTGKTNAFHRTMASRNSSITTSSNASSEQGTSGAHETEGSEQNQEDVTSEYVDEQYPDVQGEIFFLDQTDTVNEDAGTKLLEKPAEVQPGESVGHSAVNSHLIVAHLDMEDDHLDGDGLEEMNTCTNCNRKFLSSELIMEDDLRLCRECSSLETGSVTTPPSTSVNGETVSGNLLESRSHEALNHSVPIEESLQETDTGERGLNLDNVDNEGQCLYHEPIQICSAENTLVEKEELSGTKQELLGPCLVNETRNQGEEEASSRTQVFDSPLMPAPLRRSTSGKGHIVQSRSYSASYSSCDDFSCVRDSVNSIRSSIGYGSASLSSSVDLEASRQVETHIRRQSSGQKSDMENYRPAKHKRSVSSLSGASSHTFQIPSFATSSRDSFEVVATTMEKGLNEAAFAEASESVEAESALVKAEGNNGPSTDSEVVNINLEDNTVRTVLNSNEETSDGNGDSCYSINVEASSTLVQPSTLPEDEEPNTGAERVDVSEVPDMDAKSDIEMKRCDAIAPDADSDVDSPKSRSSMNELQEPSISSAANDANIVYVEGSSTSGRMHGITEESTVMLEDHGGGRNTRSLTLEEATDTILFCSSIVHNLAYEAANIAIEKENSRSECLQPAVMWVGKSNPDKKGIRSRTTGKNSSKSQKARQKTEPKPRSASSDASEKTDVSNKHIVGLPNKVDSAAPPKLDAKCNCTIM